MLRDNGGAPKTFACLEAHAAQPASRAKPNHYSQETHGRDVLEANVPWLCKTSTQALGHRADLVRSEGHNPGQPSEFYPRYHKDHCPATAGATEQNGENSVEDRGERREKKREGSLEDLLGAVHFHLVAWYLETSLLAGAGVETSERALRERIVWRGEKFPVGVSDPPGLHLLVEEVGFLDIKVSRQSKKATSGSNRCFDHDSLLPVRACCHAGGFRSVLPTIGFEPMTLAV
ncbi:hypothetical protein Salat_2980800 [Sesamum alatum]|uniref:Uncharacterized protein n=1 Tax=Sesamum alatum TaxID=300844 RepID=A0AAE2C7W1_9LAMI|nr:hypothetical protein Salat_2980800 [Sesamum alatum]